MWITLLRTPKIITNWATIKILPYLLFVITINITINITIIITVAIIITNIIIFITDHQRPSVAAEDQVSSPRPRTFSCASQESTPRWTASRRNDTGISTLVFLFFRFINANLENVFAHSAVGFHVARQLAALRAAVSAHLTLVRLFSWTKCFLVKRLHCIICWMDGMCGKHLTKRCKLMLYGRSFICSCYFMALYFILYGFILFNTFDHHLCDFSCALSG